MRVMYWGTVRLQKSVAVYKGRRSIFITEYNILSLDTVNPLRRHACSRAVARYVPSQKPFSRGEDGEGRTSRVKLYVRVLIRSGRCGNLR